MGETLSFAGWGSSLSDEYQYQPGSRADVLAREKANPDLVRRWTRHILFSGDEEFTFRPGGYYLRTMTHESPVFTEFDRGRYELAGNRLKIKPYSTVVLPYQVDIFGSTLTLIQTNSYSGQFTSYEEVPDSWAEVTAKAAEAQAFLNRPQWHVGVWRIQAQNNTTDLLLRPDGVYSATNTTPALRRVLRGRYTLAGDQIHLVPFVGQDWFVLDDAKFGMMEKTYTLDYYDGELQLIDLTIPYVQSVALAHQLPGSHERALETVNQAQAERQRADWYLGIWEVKDPAAWKEFSFRPDNRYIAKSGTQGVPSEVERGQYVMAPGKITLAPYPGNGSARGFEFDLYDGDLFLIGDSQRLVQVRKTSGSEIGVIDKARNPAALKGERGSILGRWTANRPNESVELVLRQDGQFRFQRCTNNVTSYNYGLYTVDMASRTLVCDSRFDPVQVQKMDFYGDTMTIYGGADTTPATYTVNLGSVDAAIAASLAADAEEAQVDAQWLARVPIAPIDPNAPIGDVSADPNPQQVFQGATVFTSFQYYRRLIPRIVFLGPEKISIVFDTHAWCFFPNGRVLVRFTSDEGIGTLEVWGAYEIGPKPAQTDILHCYADNTLYLVTDMGEELNMTLEDGRRNLFWVKEPQPLGDWALEQKPIPCQLAGNPDSSLINTGVSLSSNITPDPIGGAGPLQSGLHTRSPTNSPSAGPLTSLATWFWKAPPVSLLRSPGNRCSRKVFRRDRSTSRFRRRRTRQSSSESAANSMPGDDRMVGHREARRGRFFLPNRRALSLGLNRLSGTSPALVNAVLRFRLGK